MNVLLNVLKMLAIFISSFLFVQRMVRESQTLDFAVWNDFRIREPNSKVKHFQDSQVSYSRSFQRFIISHRLQKGHFQVEMSRSVDVFEPIGSARLRFYPLLTITGHPRMRLTLDSRNNLLKVKCSNTSYTIALLNTTATASASRPYQKNETHENPCFRVKNRSTIPFSVAESETRKDPTMQVRLAFQMEVMMRKHKLHKMVFAKRSHGSFFFVGIDSEKFYIFQLRNGKQQARRIGSLPIEGTFPFASILKCSVKMNCLNIKVFYNKFDRIHFLYLPPKNLLMVYRRYQTLASEFAGFSMKSLNNMKLHIDKNMLISRIFTLTDNEPPYLEINLFKYNIQQRRYRVVREKLQYVNYADSFSEISKLVFLDHTGFFEPSDNKNVFSDTIVTSPDGNSKMICLFLQNKRIICSLMLFNFRRQPAKEETIQEYAKANALALGIFALAFVGVKLYFYWKSAKSQP